MRSWADLRANQKMRIENAKDKAATKKASREQEERQRQIRQAEHLAQQAQLIKETEAQAAEQKSENDQDFVANRQWDEKGSGLKPAIINTYPNATHKQPYANQVLTWKECVSDANRYHKIKVESGRYSSDIIKLVKGNTAQVIAERAAFLKQQSDFVTILDAYIKTKNPRLIPSASLDPNFKPQKKFIWTEYETAILKAYPENYLMTENMTEFEEKLSTWERLVTQAHNHHEYKKSGREKSADRTPDDLIEKFLNQQRDFIAIARLKLAHTPKSRPAKQEPLDIGALPKKSRWWCCFCVCGSTEKEEKVTERTTLISEQQKVRIKGPGLSR